MWQIIILPTPHLPSFIYMAHDYKNEAVEKFLLPHQPDEGNYTLRVAYETAHKAYQCDHACVMVACEEWKQCEQIEDVHREAEAARVRAVADKEHREAVEWSKKRPRVEEAEEAVDMTVEGCKQCLGQGRASLW